MARAKVILVVEDDPDLRRFYRQVLMIRGYTVIAVEDGIDALRCIETDPPDLVILDIELPRLGGRDVQQSLQPIRQHATSRSWLSAAPTGDAGTRAFVCILRKPVTAEGLVAAVDECLRQAGRRWLRDYTPRTQEHHGDRRIAAYCPFCGDTAVARETRFKTGMAPQKWKCSACDAVWPERRKAS